MSIPITDISGIGTSTAETLATHGIKTVKALANATIEKISTVPGFSETRANKVKNQAIALLDGAEKPAIKKRAAKNTAESKPKPAIGVVGGMVEAMDEAGEDVEEAMQEALAESKEAEEADHEALEEMVEAMEEAGEDVATSMLEQEPEDAVKTSEEAESEIAKAMSDPIILAPEIPNTKSQKRKRRKGGKKKGKKKKGRKKGKKK